MAGTGWQNQRSLYKWIKWFKAQTSPTRDNPVALILDQHSTRFSFEIREYCREHGIMLVLLPPNMTSKLSVRMLRCHWQLLMHVAHSRWTSPYTVVSVSP